MSETDLGPRKTLFVIVIVVGCFAVLWPKVFHPMLVGSTNKHHDNDQGCCDVFSDTDVNTVKRISEICNIITQQQQQQLDGKKQLTNQEIASNCKNAILSKCGIEISAILQENVVFGKAVRDILEKIRSLNGSLCLKYQFGISPWILGVPHKTTSNFTVSSVRQERPTHLRPEMLHPALRERGRAIPPSSAPKKSSTPPKIVEGRPGPIPGMRPPMGGAGHVVPPPQKGSSISVIMPIYTVGIVVFFAYTLIKVIFKKKPEPPGFGLYPPVEPDRLFRKEVFETERSQLKSKYGRDLSGKLVVNAMSALLDEVDQELESRWKNYEIDSQQNQTSNGSVPGGKQQDQTSVKVLGMETTASCEGGQKWSRPDSPIIPPSPLPPIEEPEPPQEIYLEGALPAQSQLLVSDSKTETQSNTDSSSSDPAVVLASKMTLSVISLDSLPETENGSSTSSGKDREEYEFVSKSDLSTPNNENNERDDSSGIKDDEFYSSSKLIQAQDNVSEEEISYDDEIDLEIEEIHKSDEGGGEENLNAIPSQDISENHDANQVEQNEEKEPPTNTDQDTLNDLKLESLISVESQPFAPIEEKKLEVVSQQFPTTIKDDIIDFVQHEASSTGLEQETFKEKEEETPTSQLQDDLTVTEEVSTLSQEFPTTFEPPQTFDEKGDGTNLNVDNLDVILKEEEKKQPQTFEEKREEPTDNVDVVDAILKEEGENTLAQTQNIRISSEGPEELTLPLNEEEITFAQGQQSSLVPEEFLSSKTGGKSLSSTEIHDFESGNEISSSSNQPLAELQEIITEKVEENKTDHLDKEDQIKLVQEDVGQQQLKEEQLEEAIAKSNIDGQKKLKEPKENTKKEESSIEDLSKMAAGIIDEITNVAKGTFSSYKPKEEIPVVPDDYDDEIFSKYVARIGGDKPTEIADAKESTSSLLGSEIANKFDTKDDQLTPRSLKLSPEGGIVEEKYFTMEGSPIDEGEENGDVLVMEEIVELSDDEYERLERELEEREREINAKASSAVEEVKSKPEGDSELEGKVENLIASLESAKDLIKDIKEEGKSNEKEIVTDLDDEDNDLNDFDFNKELERIKKEMSAYGITVDEDSDSGETSKETKTDNEKQANV